MSILSEGFGVVAAIAKVLIERWPVPRGARPTIEAQGEVWGELFKVAIRVTNNSTESIRVNRVRAWGGAQIFRALGDGQEMRPGIVGIRVVDTVRMVRPAETVEIFVFLSPPVFGRYGRMAVSISRIATAHRQKWYDVNAMLAM